MNFITLLSTTVLASVAIVSAAPAPAAGNNGPPAPQTPQQQPQVISIPERPRKRTRSAEGQNHDEEWNPIVGNLFPDNEQ